MNRIRLTQIYNRGFRLGANDRAAAGLTPSSELRPKAPPAPADCGTGAEPHAWMEGYEMGYQVGASDAQLASVDIPGAHGMISGMGEQMLEMFGFFKRMAEYEERS